MRTVHEVIRGLFGDPMNKNIANGMDPMEKSSNLVERVLLAEIF